MNLANFQGRKNLVDNCYLPRGQNNAQSLDMTERICQLIGHNFPNFKLCPAIL